MESIKQTAVGIWYHPSFVQHNVCGLCLSITVVMSLQACLSLTVVMLVQAWLARVCFLLPSNRAKTHNG